MSDRRLAAWHIQAQNPAAARWIVLGPDGNTAIGVVIEWGQGTYSVEAFGPQPRDARKRPLHAAWTFYGGTADDAKGDVINTLRDFGWPIETAAAAPAQAPLPQEHTS